jgi:hypothetical protein
MKKQLRVKRLAGALAVLLAAAPVYAQNTSANLAGRITTSDGAPLAGAEVTIVHTPSGTTSRATTDAEGRYNARGLRVGGPYTVTIQKSGYQGEASENVFLLLGETSALNADLDATATELEGIEVVAASASSIFSPDKMGTGSNVTREQIEGLPSANRNIQDYIRLDPRISQVSKADGAISAGGQNTRYNLIRIDGISAADPFGLESNNLPTERQPVSLDAIEELVIDLANYDTTIAGATGAVVNAVTKSGTNEFSGSVYGTYRDKDWVGSLDGNDFTGFTSEETYGGTFGGPILQDRLFFFANYEKYTRESPSAGLAGTPFGTGAITAADLARVQAAAQGFGFDAGSLNPPDSGETEIEEYGIKLDWNINDSHRAALRYNNMEQTVLRLPELDNNSVSLSTFWYNLPKTFESIGAELFSDWSDSFSTEFKVSQRDYSAVRATFQDLPSIRVNVGNNAIFFGTELNSHINQVDTEQLTAFGAANWYVGNHNIKFGFDYEENDVFNFFGRQLFGEYVFNSIEAFESGRPNQYFLRTPRPGGSLADIPASYTQENLGLFVQDTWSVNYNLSLMFGLRADMPDFSEQRLFSQQIQDTFGYDNTVLPDDTLIQPRFGFNYTFDWDRPTQLRGGVGLFQGAPPNVWIAGIYQNTGLNYIDYSLTGNNAPNFSPNVPQPTPPGGPSAGRLSVDIMEPGFELPSSWKANLAFDHELPFWGLVASAEVLLTSVEKGIYMDRLDTFGATRIGQDGRALYWNAAGYNPANAVQNSGAGGPVMTIGQRGAFDRGSRPSNIGNVILVRNTDKGGGQQMTLSLAKPKEDHWSWVVGYTYTNAEDVSPLTSSINNSNWNSQVAFQSSENVAYDSRYAIRHRFTGTLNYENYFFGDNATRVGLFYEGRSGRPFSHIYFNDINGDGNTTNDLFYVPAGPGDVIFSGGAAMETAFFEWLSRNPTLNGYRGQVVPANLGRAGYVHNFDLRVSQEIPSFFEGHKAEISLDVMNVGNLIDSDWGRIEDYGFFSTQRIANYAGIDPATGRYIYTFRNTDNEAIQENNNDKGNTGVSRWSVMLGFRYKF